MATRATNEAVEVFRKLKKAELTAQKLERELTQRVNAMSADEVDTYVEMTTDIEVRVDEATAQADAGQWTESTRQQVERRALNGAGLDRGPV
jgi:uncharacterized protein YdaT